METHKNLYSYMCSMANLTLAWRKARKEKASRPDVLEFEENLEKNLLELHYELISKSYQPRPLTTFILRDPKIRKIAKSAFRDRIVHHAVINIIGPIFEKTFIYDSCANQKGKGTLFAIKRFHRYLRKVSSNGRTIKNHKNKNHLRGFCLKIDIKHYFEEVNHEILMAIILRRIKDEDVLWLIRKILNNLPEHAEFGVGGGEAENIIKGMPLGNLTSQFFANLYLNEFDYYVKHNLKIKHYIRYVDDFIILHQSKKQLLLWRKEIDNFLMGKLKIIPHPQKSRIIPLSKGIDFVGFRNFYHYKLLRKRNIRKMRKRIKEFRDGKIFFSSLFDSYQGWQAYACWGDAYKLRERIKEEIVEAVWDKDL